MVRREGAVWVAVCIDLCLAAQGSSQVEATAALHEQIALYVRDAVTVDAKHADVLLRRRASLTERARYQFWRLVQNRPRVRRTLGRIAHRIGLAVTKPFAYSEPLPLQPA
jgi:hypothetical protein